MQRIRTGLPQCVRPHPHQWLRLLARPRGLPFWRSRSLLYLSSIVDLQFAFQKCCLFLKKNGHFIFRVWKPNELNSCIRFLFLKFLLGSFWIIFTFRHFLGTKRRVRMLFEFLRTYGLLGSNHYIQSLVVEREIFRILLFMSQHSRGGWLHWLKKL